jgi:hypothetical protein
MQPGYIKYSRHRNFTWHITASILNTCFDNIFIWICHHHQHTFLKEESAALIRNEKITIQNLSRVCYTASPVRNIRRLIKKHSGVPTFMLGFCISPTFQKIQLCVHLTTDSCMCMNSNSNLYAVFCSA